MIQIIKVQKYAHTKTLKLSKPKNLYKVLVKAIALITVNGLNARVKVEAIASLKLNAKKEPDQPKLTLILIVLIIRKQLRILEKQQKKVRVNSLVFQVLTIMISY